MSLVADVGAANANSFETVAEFNEYLATRIGGATVLGLPDATKEQLLIMATRVISHVLLPMRVYVRDKEWFEIYPTWTGTVASETQALPWPRIGMFNLNGVAIAADVIPQELKDATSELAFQLYTKDSTLDSSIAVQGITSIKAGSVALTFKDSVMTSKMLPDAVLMFLVPSWLTSLEIESTAPEVLFDVLS